MLYYKGPNPTVDLIVTKCENKEKFVLLVRRAKSAPVESEKWALPGGFIESIGKKGSRWQIGYETEIAAAKRELKEESGLDLNHLKDHEFIFLNILDNLERDPRNTNESWVESHLYKVKIETAISSKIIGADDADLAQWFSFREVLSMPKEVFAFDHLSILENHLID